MEFLSCRNKERSQTVATELDIRLLEMLLHGAVLCFSVSLICDSPSKLKVHSLAFSIPHFLLQ